MALTIRGTFPAPPPAPSGGRTQPAPLPRPGWNMFPSGKRYGNFLPLVVGRAVVTGQVVYQDAPVTDLGSIFDGSQWLIDRLIHGTRTVLALCEAPVNTVTRCYKPFSGSVTVAIAIADAVGRIFGSNGSLSIITAATATAWSGYTGTASEGIAHSGTCHVRAVNFILDDNGSVPETRWEIEGTIGVTATSTPNAEPADFLLWLLTDMTHGLGFSSSLIDVDYGADGSLNSGFRRYTRARGWYLSRLIEQGTSIADIIDELLLATNSTIVEVDGKLRAIPLDDEASSAVTEWPGHASYPYTPPSAVLSIGDDDYDGDAPVEVKRVPRSRVRGIYPVDYTLRKDDSGEISYATNHAEWQYDVFTSANGTRRAETIDLTPWILSESHAWFVSYLRAQRETYHRARYTFKLKPAKGMGLAAGDFVSITDAQSELSAVKARIEAVEIDERGQVTAEALEWPGGTTKGFAIGTTSPVGRTSVGVAEYLGGKNSVFRQATTPTANAVGDIWIDTDDNNRLYVCTALPSTWTDARDGTIVTAQTTADGKNTIFRQASAPTAIRAGDTWIDSDDGNRIYIASAAGSGNWVASNLGRPGLAPVGEQVSSSSSSYTTSSSNFSDATNLSVTITTVGRPVALAVVSDGNGTTSSFFDVVGASGETQPAGLFKLLRDSTEIARAVFSRLEASSPSGQVRITIPPPGLLILDLPGAGTYTYKVQGAASPNGNATFTISYCKLIAYEL